jgi:hypothetical protein
MLAVLALVICAYAFPMMRQFSRVVPSLRTPASSFATNAYEGCLSSSVSSSVCGPWAGLGCPGIEACTTIRKFADEKAQKAQSRTTTFKSEEDHGWDNDRTSNDLDFEFKVPTEIATERSTWSARKTRSTATASTAESDEFDGANVNEPRFTRKGTRADWRNFHPDVENEQPHE